jgi:hypothetical protein
MREEEEKIQKKKKEIAVKRGDLEKFSIVMIVEDMIKEKKTEEE